MVQIQLSHSTLDLSRLCPFSLLSEHLLPNRGKMPSKWPKLCLVGRQTLLVLNFTCCFLSFFVCLLQPCVLESNCRPGKVVDERQLQNFKVPAIGTILSTYLSHFCCIHARNGVEVGRETVAARMWFCRHTNPEGPDLSGVRRQWWVCAFVVHALSHSSFIVFIRHPTERRWNYNTVHAQYNTRYIEFTSKCLCIIVG